MHVVSFPAEMQILPKHVPMVLFTREQQSNQANGFCPKYLLIAFAFSIVVGCDSASLDPAPTVKGLTSLITSESLILNPMGYTPLAAELKLKTTQSVQVELEIVSPNENENNLIHRFEKSDTSFTLPVLGLYVAHSNHLHIRFYDSENQLLGQETRLIDTPQLFPEPPTIEIIVNTERKKSGMNLVTYAGRTNPPLPQMPIIFDQYGHIRWYADLSTHPTMRGLNYDAGVERLQNGNLYFGDKHTDHLYEMDMFGRFVNEWNLPGYDFHHNVLELPSGNLLATVSLRGIPTVEDHIVEVDRNTGNILNVWDLRESLDYRLISEGNSRDWFHGNGLAYDEANDAIIVSGRNQGVVKLTRTNEVIWLLARHRNWGVARNGTDLKTKLLQPLDANGKPITDLRVVSGYTDHPDFSWARNQHAPKLTPQGTLLLFDNESGPPSGGPKSSRAVEYQIEEEAMTIQQVWEYGRERGRSTYSARVSDVDYHPDVNTVVFMPGDNFDKHGPNGKTIEVDYTTKEVVYEAVIRKDHIDYFIFHRVERLPIYPNNE